MRILPVPGGYHAADEPRCLRGGRVSDPRPPDDGPSWPEHDLDEPRPEEPARGWSDAPYDIDNPYRYQPPPPFHPSRYPAEHPFADEDPFPDDFATREWRPDEAPAQAEQEPPREAFDRPIEAQEAAPPESEPEIEPAPATEMGEPVTAFDPAANAWNPKRDGDRRRPTTAEQAVPWLIGLILALAGIVIVLLALIFTSPNGLVAVEATATPSASASAAPGDPSSGPSAAAGASRSARASASAEPSQGPAPTSTPVPSFGPLEMVYLGRQSGVAPIFLLRRDFSKQRDAQVMAQSEQGIEKFAWSPDGSVGAAITSGRAVALTPQQEPRRLADNIRALTFGWDAQTVYAVRITRDGADDRAQVLQIDFVGGAVKTLATVRYPHPVTGAETPLREAQFIDDGGMVRIYAVADGNLALWILGAPSVYRIDAGNGDVSEIRRQPILWSPDGAYRVTLEEQGGTTDLRLLDRSNDVVAAVSVNGLVSHVRWAGTSNEIVFTLGVLSAAGGVRQDLYVWDLKERNDPLPLTSDGVSFGAEWRGVMSNWGP